MKDEVVAVWVYMLELENGHYYTGWTTDPERRFREHVSRRKGASATRISKPVHIAACWKIEGGKSEALRVEAYIKKQKRIEKERIVAVPEALSACLRESSEFSLSVIPGRIAGFENR